MCDESLRLEGRCVVIQGWWKSEHIRNLLEGTESLQTWNVEGSNRVSKVKKECLPWGESWLS